MEHNRHLTFTFDLCASRQAWVRACVHAHMHKHEYLDTQSKESDTHSKFPTRQGAAFLFPRILVSILFPLHTFPLASFEQPGCSWKIPCVQALSSKPTTGMSVEVISQWHRHSYAHIRTFDRSPGGRGRKRIRLGLSILRHWSLHVLPL